MIANLENIQKIYTELPSSFTHENIPHDNYSMLTELHYVEGWRDVIIPEITNVQKLGSEYILVDNIVTKEVIDLTLEEIREKTIPKQISRMKFEMQVLITTGIEWDGIITFILALTMSEFYKKLLLIRLKRCTHLVRNDIDLNTIAEMMEITPEQLDEIFINGNLIE